MFLTTRKVVSFIGLKRPALALGRESKLNMTVTEWRLLRKIGFDESVKLPERMKAQLVSVVVRAIIEDGDKGTRADAMAAFKIVIEELIRDEWCSWVKDHSIRRGLER